ncbi:hypothetical protein PJJ30_28010 [Mycobacterium kansasii]|uniref:Uncharacterized protein n=1 Tax=Mycobacterium kansasii TaxID=1768 RepID=A0A7G1I6Z8_MYCKA|nr:MULTISPECIES: hypothetical protein [Mycobacterium]BCI86063.1 hypothetical protein NIIDMKKI_12690 [Mycobacterium kansasii]
MSDGNEIIDVEAVEIEDSDNLPAVIEHEASNSETIELPNRQDTLLADNPERRCAAHKRNGERCRKFAIMGSTVCRTHGGATRHVKNRARVRVENASDRLMGRLIQFAFDDTKPPDIQLRAMRDALDRAGLRPPAEVVLSQGETKPYEELFDGIAEGLTRAESRRARGVPDAEDNSAGFAADAQGDESLPPTQGDSPDPSSTGESCARREPLTNPTTYTGDGSSGGDQPSSNRSPYAEIQPEYIADQDDSPSEASGAVHRPRPRESGRERGAQPPARHITGEAAMRLASEANRAIGALKALPPGHTQR